MSAFLFDLLSSFSPFHHNWQCSEDSVSGVSGSMRGSMRGSSIGVRGGSGGRGGGSNSVRGGSGRGSGNYTSWQWRLRKQVCAFRRGETSTDSLSVVMLVMSLLPLKHNMGP